jgi:4-aminobutyrate aminotransferase-like enzyme
MHINGISHTHAHASTHAHGHGHSKMADEVKSQLESALNTLLSITEKSGNLQKDLKQDIVDSVNYVEKHICQSKKQCRRTNYENYPT